MVIARNSIDFVLTSLCNLVTFQNINNMCTVVSGSESPNLNSVSTVSHSTEEEEREDVEPRCSFCDSPFPNIDV